MNTAMQAWNDGRSWNEVEPVFPGAGKNAGKLEKCDAGANAGDGLRGQAGKIAAAMYNVSKRDNGKTGGPRRYEARPNSLKQGIPEGILKKAGRETRKPNPRLKILNADFPKQGILREFVPMIAAAGLPRMTPVYRFVRERPK
jgi:hypothetical protein